MGNTRHNRREHSSDPEDGRLSSIRIFFSGCSGVGKDLLVATLDSSATTSDPGFSVRYISHTNSSQAHVIRLFFRTPYCPEESDYYVCAYGNDLREADGVILVYSIRWRESFDEIPRFSGHIRERREGLSSTPPPQVILVGTRIHQDAETETTGYIPGLSASHSDEEEEVSISEGEKLASELDGIPFFQVDLFVEAERRQKSIDGVRKCLFEILRRVYWSRFGDETEKTSPKDVEMHLILDGFGIRPTNVIATHKVF